VIRVIGLYRWEEGAHFDHEYYHTEHMRITEEILAPHGLMHLESDRFVSAHPPRPGQIVAATNAYFPTLELAQAAMNAAGALLMADVPNYTNLKPQIHLSEVMRYS
jgi:uncharacterized protein (TIGR02118 family)